MELYLKIVNVFQPLTIFANSSILDVWQGSEYVSVQFYVFLNKEDSFTIHTR